MANTFKLSIVTPDGLAHEGDVISLVAPGENGQIGVLAHHAAMVCGLRAGLLQVKKAEETRLLFAVGAGVLEVQNNGVTALVDSAEPAKSAEDANKKLAEWARPG